MSVNRYITVEIGLTSEDAIEETTGDNEDELAAEVRNVLYSESGTFSTEDGYWSVFAFKVIRW